MYFRECWVIIPFVIKFRASQPFFACDMNMRQYLLVTQCDVCTVSCEQISSLFVSKYVSQYFTTRRKD